MGQLCLAASVVLAAVAAALGAVAILIRKLLLGTLPPLQKGTVAFFHPFADGGGGGERVLWCAVKAVQQAAPHVKVYIYVREGPSAEQLRHDAERRFNIILDRPIHVVPLRNTALVLPQRYPSFTLLGQSWGAARLGHEALSKLVPELFIDTTGWASTFPLARLAGSRVACYVHYPTISINMIHRVSTGQTTYNNSADISGSRFKSLLKLLYYRLFALLYGLVGACSQATMTNSSWTQGHIRSLWWGHRPSPLSTLSTHLTPLLSPLGYMRAQAPLGSSHPGVGEIAGALGPRGEWEKGGRGVRGGKGGKVALVYPPCDTEDLQRLPLDRKLKQLYLVSVAQFRPEKNHRLQLDAFAAVKKAPGEGRQAQAIRVSKLKMVGSCRDADDEARLADLQRYAQQLGIAADVEWCVNVPYAELKALLADAVGGVHSMVDEHFGICVVEYMAAGVIPIANDSGGPRADIVVPVPALPDDAEHAPDGGGGGFGGGGFGGAVGGASNFIRIRDVTVDVLPAEQRMDTFPTVGPATDAADAGVWGPGAKIPMQRTGYLASTVEQYAAAIREVLVMDQRDRLKIAGAAQRHASKFSTQRFMDAFTSVIAPMLPKP